MAKTSENDPAFWLLERGIKDPTQRSKPTVHKDGCYICDDPEYSLMGLPLCQPCSACVAAGRGWGHVPADDSVCSECGHDAMDDQEPSC